MNKTITKWLIRAFTVIAIIAVLPVSCKKFDPSDPVGLGTNSAKEFFSLANVTEKEVLGVANNLKQNAAFMKQLPAFIERNGVPVWSKTLNTFQPSAYKSVGTVGKIGNASEQSAPDEKGLLLIPFQGPDGHVKSFISVQKHAEDDYTYMLYNKEFLDNTKFTRSRDLEDVRNLYATLAYFDRTINGNNEFEIANTSVGVGVIRNAKLSFVKRQAEPQNDVADARTSMKPEKQGTVVIRNAFTIPQGCIVTNVTLSEEFELDVDGNTTNIHIWVNIYLLCEGDNQQTIGELDDDPTGGPQWWNQGPEGMYYPACGCYITGGGVVTYWQGSMAADLASYTLTTPDMTILNDLATEDAAADNAANNPTSCYGTNRSGNTQWWGTMEHWLIQFDYLSSHPTAKREYSIPNPGGYRGYADIANPTTGEIFEIKPDNSASIAQAELEAQLYVNQANANCPQPATGTWARGGAQPTKYFPHPRLPNSLLQVRYAGNGAIGYNPVPKTTVPDPVPVLLPEPYAQKVRDFIRYAVQSINNVDELVLRFLRNNPQIVPYLMQAAAGIIIGTLVQDILTAGAGIIDDWYTFLVARSMVRVAIRIY